MVTVAIYGWECENERDACVGHVRAQTLQDVEILTQGEGEDSISFRNRAIAEAKGSHITFLHAKAQYVFPNALQLMALTAQAEDAAVVAGQTSYPIIGTCRYVDGLPCSAGWVPLERCIALNAGLSGFLLDLSFLKREHLQYIDVDERIEAAFLQKALILAGRCYSLGRTVVSLIHAPLKENALDFEEIVCLYCELLGCAVSASATEYYDILVQRIQDVHGEAIRSYYWKQLRLGTVDFARKKIDLLKPFIGENLIRQEFIDPILSVIMPVCSSGEGVSAYIEFISTQEFDSMEIIVLGSRENTEAILAQSGDRSVRWIEVPSNDIAELSNVGLDNARGKYVYFFNSSIRPTRTALSTLVRDLQTDDDCEIATSFVSCQARYEFNPEMRGVQPLSPMVAGELCPVANAFLCRRRFIEGNGIKFLEGKSGALYAFFFFLITRARKVYFEPMFLYSAEAGFLDCTVQGGLKIVAEYLEHDDNLIYLGCLYRHLSKAFESVVNTETREWISSFLHTTHYAYRRDFLGDSEFPKVAHILDSWHNYEYGDLAHVSVPNDFPPARPRPQRTDRPILSYIVPVFNVAPYLSTCLESIRRQTRSDIEIICVDDGSTDDSPAILNFYKSLDERIKVIRKTNSGLGMTRNQGVAAASGKYITFIDGDDWIDSTMCEYVCAKCEQFRLECCAYDLIMYDHKTRKSLPSWWYLKSRSEDLVVNRLIRPQNLPKWDLKPSACIVTYNREFFIGTELKFTNQRFGEDLMFTMSILPRIRRYYIADKVFYHYRRNVPNSIITRLAGAGMCADADLAQIQMFDNLAELYQRWYKSHCLEHEMQLFRERVLVDILYYGEKSLKLRAWFREYGWDRLELSKITATNVRTSFYNRLQTMKANFEAEADIISDDEKTPPVPDKVGKVFRQIEEHRKGSVQDAYIVTGQLNSATNEPIDSWTFFKWLVDNGHEAYYVIWRKHAFVKKITKGPYATRVIMLDGNGVEDYEFVNSCKSILIRCRAVIQENAALNSVVRKWLKGLDGLLYVFLQHGVTYPGYSPVVARTMSLFNCVNVCSEREKRLIIDEAPPSVNFDDRNFVVAGLPRYDLLIDRSSEVKGENVVLLMLTWRDAFAKSETDCLESAYFKRLGSFLCQKNLELLAKNNIRLVLALHHHLLNHGVRFDEFKNVTIIDSLEISYWIRHAKACITDISSVAWDFLYQEKPALFWMIDEDDLFRNVAVHDDGGKVLLASMRMKSFVNCFQHGGQVIEKLCHYAGNGFQVEDEVKSFASTFFSCRGNVCETLFRGMENLIREGDGL